MYICFFLYESNSIWTIITKHWYKFSFYVTLLIEKIFFCWNKNKRWCTHLLAFRLFLFINNRRWQFSIKISITNLMITKNKFEACLRISVEICMPMYLFFFLASIIIFFIALVRKRQLKLNNLSSRFKCFDIYKNLDVIIFKISCMALNETNTRHTRCIWFFLKLNIAQWQS